MTKVVEHIGHALIRDAAILAVRIKDGKVILHLKEIKRPKHLCEGFEYAFSIDATSLKSNLEAIEKARETMATIWTCEACKQNHHELCDNIFADGMHDPCDCKHV